MLKIETTSRQKAKILAKDWLSRIDRYADSIFATVVVYGRDNRIWVFKFIWSDVCEKWLYD